MRVLRRGDQDDDDVIAEHVALPPARAVDRCFVRLDMISSVDGGTTLGGVSGGLGNRHDHAVFAALRESADAVLVGLGTIAAEHYSPPSGDHLRIYVVAEVPDVAADPELFASGAATLILPEDAPPTPAGVPDLRVGMGQVDLGEVAAALAGEVVVLEGGPRLAGEMLALGLVDELFHTIAPLVLAGESARMAHGPEADPRPWGLLHGFCDDEGYLFLRYGRD